MSIRNTLRLMIGLVLVVILVAGCGPPREPTPADTSVAEAQRTPTASVTKAPTAIPTSVPPTATPTPVPTSTAVPPTPTPSGDIVQGQLIGRDSQNPIPDAYILLCDVVDPDAPEPECRLSSNLVAKTDSEGGFEITSVPEGMYVIVYGLAEDVEGSNQEWDGISVSYSVPILSVVGGTTDPFGGSLGLFVRGNSKVDITGDQIGITDGGVISEEFGLSIEYRDAVPSAVVVLEGETTRILVEVTGQ